VLFIRNDASAPSARSREQAGQNAGAMQQEGEPLLSGEKKVKIRLAVALP